MELTGGDQAFATGVEPSSASGLLACDRLRGQRAVGFVECGLWRWQVVDCLGGWLGLEGSGERFARALLDGARGPLFVDWRVDCRLKAAEPELQ